MLVAFDVPGVEAAVQLRDVLVWLMLDVRLVLADVRNVRNLQNKTV